jgi:hypothetical protein
MASEAQPPMSARAEMQPALALAMALEPVRLPPRFLPKNRRNRLANLPRSFPGFAV